MECRSVRKALPVDALKKQPSSSRKNDPKSSRSIKSNANRNDGKKVESAIREAETRDDSSDMEEVDGKPRSGSLELHAGMVKPNVEREVEANSTSSGSGSSSSPEVTGSENTRTSEMTYFPDSEDRVSAQDNSVQYQASDRGNQSKTEDSVSDDDVENQNPGILGQVTNDQATENGLKSNSNIRYAVLTLVCRQFP